MRNEFPRALVERMKTAPNVVKLKDFWGFFQGKPMSRLYFKTLDGGHPEPRKYVVDAECAYCGGISTSEMRRKYSSCPNCAGPWDEALVRGNQ
jgi:hypothetical protein